MVSFAPNRVLSTFELEFGGSHMDDIVILHRYRYRLWGEKFVLPLIFVVIS